MMIGETQMTHLVVARRWTPCALVSIVLVECCTPRVSCLLELVSREYEDVGVVLHAHVSSQPNLATLAYKDVG